MEEIFYKIAMITIIITFFIIRSPFVKKLTEIEQIKQVNRKREIFLVSLNFIGMMILPITYSLTEWFDDYAFELPEIVRILGIVISLLSIVFILWIHIFLGKNWSLTLDITDKHKLITDGPYKHIRHPMYTAFYGFTFSLILVSANYILILCLILFQLLILFRVSEEEKMLVGMFGREYEDYKRRTKKFFPKII